tara:strand:+ start:424 stop:630 length:207 start_codon:yes stop_codon:yes gene_type:complete
MNIEENLNELEEFLEQQDAYESDDSDKLFTVAGMTNDKEQSFNEFHWDIDHEQILCDYFGIEELKEMN